MLRKSIVFIAISVLGIVSPEICAEEPTELFLAALRDRGHYDIALKYLDRMSTSPLAPPAFKEEIDYRRGMLLVAAARGNKNPSMRQMYLDQAEQALSRFLSSHAEHPLAALARSQLGNIIVERARGLMSKAKQDESNRASLMRQAASTYEKAYEALLASRTEIGEQFKATVGSDSKSKLDEIKSQYVQTYLAIARVLFEHAEALQDDEQKYQAKLTEAATAFEEVAQKYRKFSAGIYALLYEGMCYQLLGEDQRALTYFKELLQNEDNSRLVRRLKSQALARSIESWLKVDRERGPDKAIPAAENWWKRKRANEERDPAWLELRLALAKAYKQKSAVASSETQASRALSEARTIAGELARRTSPVQNEAQTLLVSLGRGEQESVATDPEAAANFAEAREAAKRSLDAMKLANAKKSILSSQLDKISDPATRKEIEAKLAEAETESAQLTTESLALFEKAATLATEADIDALNGVRYYLAYLYYQQQRYRRAAVLASFVALRHSDSLAAKECASVALAARQRLYQDASPAERITHTEQIAKIAELMVSNWPQERQADAALMTLLDVKLQKGEIEQAQSFLDRIPEDSPQRIVADLRVGQALWREYRSRVAQETSGGAADSDVAALKQQAQDVLARALQRVSDSPPDETTVRAALSLAQVYVDAGRPQDALDILSHRRYGALTLAELNSTWLDRIPGLDMEAYKTAIRAHVASASTAEDSADSLRSAEQILDKLRSELEQQPGGKDKMIGIYISLARDLERQLTVASPTTRKTLSKGFESFLKSAAKGTEDVAVLNWVGATFYSLGNSMLQGSKSSPEAQRYFTEAASAYRQVLEIAEKTPSALTEDALAQVKVRQAMSLRQLGKYQDSVDLFATVLNERNQILNIQVEAAKTLQQWGSAGNTDGYQKAIVGDRPGSNGRNTIWGWGRIAQLVSKSDKYRDTFHEARYNLALSRYKMAMASAGQKQNELLRRAKSDILLTQKLFDLGGPRYAQRYETLLKTIQKSLGEPVTGFAGTK